jgi:hypothetical protein
MRPVLQSLGATVVFTVVCAWVLPAAAQSLRDPTLPPWGSGLSDGRGAAPVRGLHGPLSVLVVNGQPYLVVGTRLYAQGQQLGATRIERITETEVWLREGRELRKISNFVGVQRRSVTSTASVPACAASAAKPATTSRSSNSLEPAAACDSAQP